MSSAGACRGRLAVVATLAASCAQYAPLPLGSAPSPARLDDSAPGAAASSMSPAESPARSPLPIDPAGPWTPDQVAVLAVLANPDLRALRAKVGVAHAQAFEAGLLPDPVLSAGLDRPLAGAGFVDAWTIAVAQDLAALATRSASEAMAAAAVEQARLDVAWQEWQVAGQGRLLAARLDFLGRAQPLADERCRLAQAAVSHVEAAVRNGDLAEDARRPVLVALAAAEDGAAGISKEHAAALRELNHLLGRAPGDAVVLAAAPDAPLGALDAAALTQRAIRARPDLQALAAGYAGQEAAVRRAILGQFPQLNLTLTRARDTSAVPTFGPSVSLQLPAWNRNRGAIAVAQADRERLRAEYDARLVATRADVAGLVDEIAWTETQRSRAAQRAGDLEAVAVARAAAAGRGDVTAADADTARAAAIEARLGLMALDQSRTELRAGLEVAVGEPLEGDVR